MNIFQSVYNFFKKMKSPDWYVKLTEVLLNNCIIPSLQKLGSYYISRLELLVISASQKNEMTGSQKLDYVITTFRKECSMANIKDRELNLLTEALVSKMKNQQG